MKVILMAAVTLCGRISPPTMGSPEDRQLLERLRGETDAGLMGAATLRLENPQMRGPDGIVPPDRIRALVSFSGNVPVAAKSIFSCPSYPFLFTRHSLVDRLRQELPKTTTVVGVAEADGRLLIRAVLGELAATGVESVLVEGGGRLNYACLHENVVDELYLTICPKVSGDSAAAALADGPRPLGNPFMAMEFVGCKTSSYGEVFLRYRRQTT